MKSYPTERPVNSAAISPLKNHVVLGGGQEAMDVTTTTSKAGKFEARSVNKGHHETNNLSLSLLYYKDSFI